MSSNPNIVKKLQGLGETMVGQIENGDGPTFETGVRTKSNTYFDESFRCLRTGNKKEIRKFLSVAQAKTFMQTVAIASKTKQFINQNLHTSIRGLFYQLKFSLGEDLDEDLFTEQTESNALIEDLEVALKLKREDLNLTTDRKGFVAGPMVIEDNFGGEKTTIDLEKQGRSGWSIPSDVDKGMEIKKLDASYVLVVEKDALWQRLNEDKFWKKENCLLVTPKGQSTRGTRRLLRKLADEKLPVYCLMDCDAWGWYIYWTIKTGSMNLAYLGSDFAVPESRFIGVTMSDINEFKFLDKLTIKAKDVDVKRAEEMLGYPWINRNKDWVRELNMVLKTKKKIEQDALQGERLTFVGEYINQKINNKEWLS